MDAVKSAASLTWRIYSPTARTARHISREFRLGSQSGEKLLFRGRTWQEKSSRTELDQDSCCDGLRGWGALSVD